MTETSVLVEPGDLAESVVTEIAEGGRFAGLVATAGDESSTTLRALVAVGDRFQIMESVLTPGVSSYPALTPRVPAAAWYEREIHDLFGIEPIGHPRLDPLVLPLGRDAADRPRPGAPHGTGAQPLDGTPLPAHVEGEGLFTIPYGPVRSGVFETVEYLVETYGEDIPHLRTRIHYKHRGIERRFGELGTDDAVLLAERVEGTASVAHASAFCQALESLAGADVPPSAALMRVVHAELERVACHLDSVIRHTEGAGQAVAYARMSFHKERLMRLRAQLCGHRFGRGVVVPGGVSGPSLMEPRHALSAVSELEHALAKDLSALMTTPSFLDRLRRTGVIPYDVAAVHGALGPVGRGSGLNGDTRAARPYGAYRSLGFQPAERRTEGDARARQLVRLDEIAGAFHLVRQALDELDERGPEVAWRRELPAPDGLGIGWVEAPQGELLYVLEARGGRILRVKPRTASFHNLALFPQAFRGDILTDFVFIEASFGVTMAGVSG